MIDSSFTFDVERVLEEAVIPSVRRIIIGINFKVSSETIGLTFHQRTLIHLFKLEFAVNKGLWIFRISLGESDDSTKPVDKGQDSLPLEKVCNVRAIGCVHRLQCSIFIVCKIESCELGVKEHKPSGFIFVFDEVLDVKVSRFSLISHPGVKDVVDTIMSLIWIGKIGAGRNCCWA